MSLLVTLLTIVLFLDCLVLTLLILMQLPKKEAGLGQAFGSSATDALLGAGSGTVLTKITRYAATTFFVLAIILSILGPRANEEKRRQRAFTTGTSSRPVSGQTTPAPLAPLVSSNLLTTTLAATNALAPTNAPAAATNQ